MRKLLTIIIVSIISAAHYVLINPGNESNYNVMGYNLEVYIMSCLSLIVLQIICLYLKNRAHTYKKDKQSFVINNAIDRFVVNTKDTILNTKDAILDSVVVYRIIQFVTFLSFVQWFLCMWIVQLNVNYYLDRFLLAGYIPDSILLIAVAIVAFIVFLIDITFR